MLCQRPAKCAIANYISIILSHSWAPSTSSVMVISLFKSSELPYVYIQGFICIPSILFGTIYGYVMEYWYGTGQDFLWVPQSEPLFQCHRTCPAVQVHACAHTMEMVSHLYRQRHLTPPTKLFRGEHAWIASCNEWKTTSTPNAVLPCSHNFVHWMCVLKFIHWKILGYPQINCVFERIELIQVAMSSAYLKYEIEIQPNQRCPIGAHEPAFLSDEQLRWYYFSKGKYRFYLFNYHMCTFRKSPYMLGRWQHQQCRSTSQQKYEPVYAPLPDIQVDTHELSIFSLYFSLIKWNIWIFTWCQKGGLQRAPHR